MFRTLVHAVQTDVAFGPVPPHAADRVVSSLATKQATIAVVAMLRILHEAEDRPSGGDSQQRAERAEGPAPEPSNPEIQYQDEQKDEAKPKPLSKVGLLKAKKRCPEQEMECAAERLQSSEATVLKKTQRSLQGIVCRGQNGKAQGPDENRKWIEPTYYACAQKGCNEGP